MRDVSVCSGHGLPQEPTTGQCELKDYVCMACSGKNGYPQHTSIPILVPQAQGTLKRKGQNDCKTVPTGHDWTTL